jgi:hypothetical protein
MYIAFGNATLLNNTVIKNDHMKLMANEPSLITALYPFGRSRVKSFLKDLYIRSLASLTTGTGIESITMAWL